MYILKKAGIFILSVILVLYIAFVVIVPLAIQPIKYKTEIQNFIKNSSGLDFNFENAKIITTPLLAVGLKADKIQLSMPDNKNILESENFTIRVSLPSLLFKTLKVTYANLDNPIINLDINKKGTQYDIIDFFEKQSLKTEQNDIKSQEAQETSAQVETTANTVNNFKIKINKIIINNYAVNINETRNKHKLSLCGDNLLLSFDGKNLIIKTNPKLLYDDKTNITANFDIKTYIPEFSLEQNSQNTDNETPFINLVEIYGKYDLKSNINSKLVIEKTKDSPKINGKIYITDTTMNLSGMQLPESYLKFDFGDYKLKIDTNICIAENEKANILGSVKYGKKFNTDLTIKTDKINLSSLLNLTQALMNSLNIPNTLKTIHTAGYMQADLKLNTDLKTIKSSGNFILENGLIKDSSTGLAVNNIKSNILFDNNIIKIKDTHAYINGTPFIAEGSINDKSEADIKIYTKNLPLSALYSTFAPAELKKTCLIKNGILSLDILLNGKLESIEPKVKTEIINLVVRDNIDNIDITNGSCNIDLDTDLKTYNGKITNKNLIVSAPSMSTTIRNSLAEINFNDKNINIKPTDFVINGVSTFNISGNIKDYIKKPEIKISGKGSVRATDIKNLAGKDIAPFIKASGIIPVNLLISGNDKKQNILFRTYGSANEYVTPADFEEIIGKPSTIQILAEIANNKISLKQTGIYSGSYTDMTQEISGTPLASVTGSVNLDNNLMLNNIKISTNGTQKLNIYAFDKSSINGNADITISGTISNPILKGIIKTDNLNIPQLHTKMKSADISLNGNNFNFNLYDLNLNGTTMHINGTGLLDYKPIITLTDIKIASDYLDSDKAMKVTEYMANVPALNSSSNTSASIPAQITKGSINLKKLSSGEIIAENITGNITLFNDTVYIKDLKASAFDGIFSGDVSMNLITSAIKAKVSGSGMNADKTVTACAAMKNTIFGTLDFNADITLKGATYIEQMQTLNGKANFNITKGQFGSLGKFETFLKADNLASITFISTKIGTLINKVSPHNTADFDKLNGMVTFKNGLMTISPITSTGKNMSLYITGNLNLVNNNSDMLVLGRISDEVTSLLGPLEQLNPVRLLKKSSSNWAVITVGVLNAMNQKSTPAEINKIPNLTPTPSTDNTSKFIVKINGNIEKPQSAIKSFKWLSPETDLTKAESALSPKEVVDNVVKSIPKNKEEALNSLKEAGKNTLMNLGKQLLAPTTETTEQKSTIHGE